MKKSPSAPNVFIYFNPPKCAEDFIAKFTYRKIDMTETDRMAEKFGDYITRFKCLHFGDSGLTFGAFYNNEPVGIISVYSKLLPSPLDYIKETVIDVLDVDKAFRRQGIARELVSRAEKWAGEQNYLQIRAWCSTEKTESVKTMLALGYSMCPAKIWIESRKEEAIGFYAVKILHSVTRTML